MSSNSKKKIKAITFSRGIEQEYPNEKDRDRYRRKLRRGADSLHQEYLHELGQDIQEGRKKANKTQSDLAESIHTTKSAISRIENGKQNLTIKMIKKICDAIGRPYRIRVDIS